MPRRAITFSRGYYYHVFNRGFDKKPVFYTAENYVYALDLIKKYFRKYSVTSIAYCLMPNHYHFLLRQDGDLPLGNAIRDIFNAYVQDLNRQRQKSGSLFQGRFKAIQIEDEAYLIHLCRYIHRNPIDTYPHLVNRIEDWLYSNYPEWIRSRNGKLVDHDFINSYFKKRKDYSEFVLEQPAAKVFRRMERYLFD